MYCGNDLERLARRLKNTLRGVSSMLHPSSIRNDQSFNLTSRDSSVVPGYDFGAGELRRNA